MNQNPRTLAISLFGQLAKQTGKGAFPVPALDRPVAKTLLAAAPEVKMEFVRHVVETFGKLAVRKGKDVNAPQWFHGKGVPAAAEKVSEKLLRKALPFTDDMLAEMLEQIAGMYFITFAPVLEQLVRVLEKRADAGPLPKRIRSAAARIVDELLVKNWSADDAENCGLPRAIDRKLASQIEQLLASPA